MNSGILLRVALLFTLISGSFASFSQVTANFTATPVSGCSPLVVQFTDQSNGGPTQWRWDLGNGTISFLQNPSATYFSPGRYTVKLVARNSGGVDSVVKTDYIEVYGKPVIDFNPSTTSGCYPLPVSFTDMTNPVSGTANSWLWDFGDGTTSTVQNPSHVYTSARSFSVTLQVRNSAGCISTLTKPNLIQISQGVLAQFTNDNPQTCTPPVTISFQNQSTGTGVVNYQWDFGDGSTSDLLSPSHTYNNNGTYTVKLIVTNGNGCSDTIVKTNAVTVGSVDATFADPGNICQGSKTTFNNTSVPAPASVIWYFGDGTTSTQFNPQKQYNTAGTYNVKMVANFGACTDSVTKTVTVLPKPTVAFSTTDTSSCKAPFTVNFNNQSAPGTTSLWSFGDGSTSTDQNPSHTYTRTGLFSVKLTVTNSNGCSDSLLRTNYINITRPRATISAVPDSGCVPLSKTFNLSVITSDPVSSYQWNFGDGNTSTAAAPVNTYINEGVYNVSVIIVTATGCTDTARVNRAIITNNKPTAAFSANPISSCAKDNITFTDLSTGGPTKWLWDFGDSTTSSLRNPVHQYMDTGYFDIKLKIWKGGCMDSILVKKYIYINPPVAKFNVGFTCARPFERVFTDQSIGANSWEWDFGDGTTSTVQSPTHIYTATGLYNVSLRVVNLTSGCDYTTTKQVQVYNAKAQFTASDTSVCRGDTVSFISGLSLNDVTALNWNFGDGTPSINSFFRSTSMDHVFNRNGRFNVRLTVTDKLGCQDVLIKTGYIFVSGPVAKFAPGSTGACSNNAVTFIDSSRSDGINSISQWQWNYGDSITETLNAGPFQHVYANPGAYVVSLKVTDSRGCSDSTKLTSPLTISKPKANFTTIDTFSCPNKPVRFVSQSTGPGLTYRWDFGDNTTGTGANPSHSYTSDGLYTVKLTITDTYGCGDSITIPNYVNIVSPVSMFAMSDSIGNCPPLVINFTDASVNALTRRWDFGDSTYSTELNPTHFYNYPGTYFVNLTVTGKGGCTSTFQRKVIIKGPEGIFSYTPLSGCNPVNVGFTAHTNGRNRFVWDFDDGNTINTNDSILNHVYTYAGKYIPKLILIDQSGCQVPIVGHDTVVVSSIITNFGFTNRVLCDSGMISFHDSSAIVNDAITSYQWNFGDGNSSTQASPVHQYSSTGLYYPTLITVTEKGCRDTLVSSTPVKIVASPRINITSTGNGCTPLTVTFNSQLLNPDSSSINWQWNFANGNTAVVASPTAQQYNTAGIYPVNLVATNSSGCTDTATINIEAYAIPQVNAGADFILCNGSSKTIQATGAATYSWSPATGLSCTNCSNPSTAVTSNISYVVTGTSIHGCSASDSIVVTVKNKFVFSHSSSDSVCRGGSKKLTASGADSYEWTPSSSLDNATTNEPTATPDTTTTYRVIGSDNIGCFKDTGYIAIRVNPLPTVEAGIDKTINVGTTVDLVPEISPDVVNVNWLPTTGLFRNFYPGITVKPTENTEYTVEVKNRGGCVAKDRVTVFVICNNSNLFIPNTFSPNGDGTNDVFYPRGTGVFKIKSLRIFTRWGELIYERSNFDANNPAYGWNGTSKGMQLNPDVFVYTLDVVCENGSVLTYRGNIALIK